MFKRFAVLSFCFLHLLSQTALAINFSPMGSVLPPPIPAVSPIPNVSAYDPTGISAHTHFTYDAFGNLDQVTDANNHTIDYDYDALGWLNKVTNPLGYVTKHTYDANGNIIKTERQADG